MVDINKNTISEEDDEDVSVEGEYICRLCLNNTDSLSTIFEDRNLNNKQQVPLVQLINDLFQIKYEHMELLPSHICQRCLYMVEAFNQFKTKITTCETELQKYLKIVLEAKVSKECTDRTPGLNGNPGIFEPDKNCIVTEIDPNQDCESSEDEFSMESDSEADADTAPPTKHITLTHEKQSTMAESNLTTPATPMEIAVTPRESPISTMQNVNEYQNKNTYLCQYCDMAFTTSSECTDHEQQHDAANPYACAFCQMRTTSRPNLIYHIREAHEAERPFICALCNKGFCRRSDLKKHTIVHTGVRPFTCPSCSKSFSRNTNLTKHMRIHTGERPHVCQLCPRSFTTAAELHLHTRTHTEVKPFRCLRCPSSFTRRDKLVLHERTHSRRDSELPSGQGSNTSTSANGISTENMTGTNQTENIVVPLNPFGTHTGTELSENDPYGNSILAAQLQQRPMHSNINLPPTQAPTSSRHSHARIFKCEICAMTFNRERDFQRHQALHLDTLFTCKQCGMVFNRREKLTRHENEQHAPQYPCNICRITFSKPDDLEMHRKMHELQKTVAMNAQAAVNAAGGYQMPNAGSAIMPLPGQRPTAADLSFYTNLVPTMNLGFYSEIRPEESNNM